MTAFLNSMIQTIGAIAILLPEVTEVMPPGKTKLILQGVALLGMGITGIRASHYNPDGTPAEVAYQKEEK